MRLINCNTFWNDSLENMKSCLANVIQLYAVRTATTFGAKAIVSSSFHLFLIYFTKEFHRFLMYNDETP